MGLCFRYVKKTDVVFASTQIQKFLEEYVDTFGKEALTPNMHMMLHIPEDINDFGSVHAHW